MAATYLGHLIPLRELITPAIVVYEVYKVMRRERSEEDARTVAAVLRATEVVSLSPELATLGAEVALRHRLSMADAIIYATALSRTASLVTSDDDFKDLPGVIYLPKP